MSEDWKEVPPVSQRKFELGRGLRAALLLGALALLFFAPAAGRVLADAGANVPLPGQTFTVADTPFGSVADWGTPEIASLGYCYDWLSPGPAVGDTYTVVAQADNGLTAFQSGQIALALNALVDPAYAGLTPEQLAEGLLDVIWFYTNDRPTESALGAEILTKATDGTYTSPMSVVWLLPDDGSLQPMLGLPGGVPTAVTIASTQADSMELTFSLLLATLTLGLATLYIARRRTQEPTW